MLTFVTDRNVIDIFNHLSNRINESNRFISCENI